MVRLHPSWWLTATVILTACGHRPIQTTETPIAIETDAAEPPPAAVDAPALPHLRIDRERDLVDLEAKIAGRTVDWLELLACSPQSREHESIVTVETNPKHIHLALLMLGLEPGKPVSWERSDNGYVMHPPSGPPVAVSFVLSGDGGQVEIPANRWILNRTTGQDLPDNIWLFAGSKFETFEGKSHFMAEVNGTVASLVGFGDDLLARPTRTTQDNDEQAWSIRENRVPPVGTPLILRLRPVRKSESRPSTPHPAGQGG